MESQILYRCVHISIYFHRQTTSLAYRRTSSVSPSHHHPQKISVIIFCGPHLFAKPHSLYRQSSRIPHKCLPFHRRFQLFGSLYFLIILRPFSTRAPSSLPATPQTPHTAIRSRYQEIIYSEEE